MPGASSDRIRVLVAEDSPVTRAMLVSMFESDPTFEVVAEARDGREAVDMARTLRPDLLTLDLEMPILTGIEAIEQIMSSNPVPILVVSGFANAQNAYAAISRGAVDVIDKPGTSESEIEAFLEKARMVSSVPVITHVNVLRLSARIVDSPLMPASPGSSTIGPVFAIASSTGGPQALARILGQLPITFSSPILIAQHIAPGFAAGMAKWLATVSRLPVKLAEGGEALSAGVVYMSPSEAHMTVAASGKIAFKVLKDTDIYRPSCDALLESVASTYGSRGVGIILTGMGHDGASGMEALKAAGGMTIAQDEASSVVFGMNQAAIARGSIRKVVALADISLEMMRLVEDPSAYVKNPAL